MFSLNFVKGSKSAEGGSKCASGYGPGGGSKSASGYGPGGPNPLADLDRGGPNPLGHRWFFPSEATKGAD